jgi:hypothetical protein
MDKNESYSYNNLIQAREQLLRNIKNTQEDENAKILSNFFQFLK